MRGDRFFLEVAKKPPFSSLHPEIAAFLKEYLAGEKVISFGDRFVVNTQFPPYPGPAFDRLAENFGVIGEAGAGRLYSVTVAVTNRCPFSCWHCYNSGRSQVDTPLETLNRLAATFQEMGAVIVTLTGGEPLLRPDLEEIAAGFDPRTCLIVGTTGDGLTPERARRLRSAGVFATGISLDSDDESEHDRMRGRQGAFRTALAALDAARRAGLYPYVVTVATRRLLERRRFIPFLEFARGRGALEVHLLEPSLTGRLAGRNDVDLRRSDRRTVLEYQREVAAEEGLPILSSYAYLEGPRAFGCGAGLTHLYIDGSGDVCPCNLVPLSFGNVTDEPLERILGRMREHFRQPRPGCAGRLLAPHIPAGRLPAPPDVSCEVCARRLPRRHAPPRFFAIRSRARSDVGRDELRQAYDGVHEYYDAFWLSEASKPVDRLVETLAWTGRERVFEAGCGTGYATALLARHAESVTAADISSGMLEQARLRLGEAGISNVRLLAADAIEAVKAEAPCDVIFTSWVLGYVPPADFFVAAAAALKPGGRLALIVHRENSPREPLEIFAELVARDPSVLLKRVAFDFPRDADHLRRDLARAGLRTEEIREDAVVFRYDTAEEVLEHLLKSGAGTAFYEALDPERREDLTRDFLKGLSARNGGRTVYEVAHDYIACVACKPGTSVGLP